MIFTLAAALLLLQDTQAETDKDAKKILAIYLDAGCKEYEQHGPEQVSQLRALRIQEAQIRKSDESLATRRKQLDEVREKISQVLDKLPTHRKFRTPSAVIDPNRLSAPFFGRARYPDGDALLIKPIGRYHQGGWVVQVVGTRPLRTIVLRGVDNLRSDGQYRVTQQICCVGIVDGPLTSYLAVQIISDEMQNLLDETARDLTETAEYKRTWKSDDGKFSVDAQLVGLADDEIKLKKASGEVITVPADRLSTDDRSWLRDLAAGEIY